MWPKPLPNNWIVGAVAGVAVDARDHVWIIAPAVDASAQRNPLDLESRAARARIRRGRHLVSAWGGPGAGYEWPQLEHGIYVDPQDNVWLAGGDKDAHLLKFTREGKFLMQIGHQGRPGQQRHANLGAPAHMVVDAAANELYIADGYVNHRVIVFDAVDRRVQAPLGRVRQTARRWVLSRGRGRLPGPFKRRRTEREPAEPVDPKGPPAPQFRIVHAVRISRDGLVYVCDRTNDRIQVFRKDGTFVQEVVRRQGYIRQRLGMGHRVFNDPEQKFLVVPTAPTSGLYTSIGRRLQVDQRFGGAGHWAGQFYGAHNLAVNSRATCSSPRPTRASACRNSSPKDLGRRRRQREALRRGAQVHGRATCCANLESFSAGA